MSDELRAWLESAKLSLDVGDRALWAVQYGPKLIAKVEELADELHHAIDHHVVRGDNRTVCVECGRIDGHALGCWVGEAEKALRAPGGGEDVREHGRCHR